LCGRSSGCGASTHRTPEPHTDTGRKAKRFLSGVLGESPTVIVKTYKSDKYDRYLSDIFHLKGEKDPEKINREGIFLNQELLDRGLAVMV